MIYNHQEGLERHYSFKSKFDIELELVCLNSEYMEITSLLNSAKKFSKDYPDNVILKESEFHEESNPYYELSIFCYKKDLNDFEKIAKDFGFEIDIVHEL